MDAKKLSFLYKVKIFQCFFCCLLCKKGSNIIILLLRLFSALCISLSACLIQTLTSSSLSMNHSHLPAFSPLHSSPHLPIWQKKPHSSAAAENRLTTSKNTINTANVLFFMVSLSLIFTVFKFFFNLGF